MRSYQSKIARSPTRSRSPILHGPPRRGVRRRVALVSEARAGEQQAALVGKMRIEGVPLHAGAFRHHAHRGGRGTDAAVQRDGGFHDPLPGLGLLLGAAPQGVGPGHVISLHSSVHPILT